MHKPQLVTPVTYPELKKNIVLLDKKIGNRDKIAKHSIDLFNKRKTSIYKKLFNRLTNKDMSFNAQVIRTIRNMNLKKLVELNPENFPVELGYDEYKSNVIAKEDKVNSMILKMKEAGKKEKIKKDPLDLSRNSSMVRRESIDEQMLKKEKEKEKKQNKKDQTKNVILNHKEETEDENIEEEDKEQDQSYENDDYINENMEDDSQNINYDEEGDIDEGGEF